MPVLADESPHDRLPVVVEPVHPPQAERGVQVPRLVAPAERAPEPDPPARPSPVVDGAPHAGPLEVLEHAPEEHVAAPLLDVDTPGPVADVEGVPAEAACEELVALLAAEVPRAGGEVGACGPEGGPFPLPCGQAHGSVVGRSWDGQLGLGGAVDCVEVEVVAEGPAPGRGGGGAGIDGGRGIRGGGGGRGKGGFLGVGRVGADLALEAEVGALEEDAGVEETGAADGELVEGGAADAVAEVGEEGGDAAGAAEAAADVADERAEARGDAGEPGPVAGVRLQLRQDVQHDVVRYQRERIGSDGGRG